MVRLSENEIKHRLQQMDPYKFEELVAEIWELQDYQTIVRKGSGDKGIDIEATRHSPFSEKILIQAKRFGESSKIGSNQVRKYATLYQQVPDADNVVIVSTSEFTSEAEQLADDLNVKTIDGNGFSNLVGEEIQNITNSIFEYQNNIEDLLLEAKTNAATLSNKIELGNDKLNQAIKSLYEKSPKFKSFKWPVDKLGKRWITDEDYISITITESSTTPTFNRKSILGQFVIADKNDPVVKFKIVFNLGDKIEYSDIQKEIKELEKNYACKTYPHEKMPGMSVVYEKQKKHFDNDNIVEIVLFIINSIFKSHPDKISHCEFDSTPEGITSVCPKCGCSTEDDASFCQNCGQNLF